MRLIHTARFEKDYSAATTDAWPSLLALGLADAQV